MAMTVYESHGSSIPGLVAAEDLTGAQFRFVTISANNRVSLATGPDQAIGVLQNAPNVGEAAAVWGVGSISKVVAGIALFGGSNAITSDANGRVVPAPGGTQASSGIVLLGVDNVDELACVYLSRRSLVL